MVRTVIAGNPDEAHISTSIIEGQNLTVRMSMRRFTRLTGFSKKLANMKAGVSPHFAQCLVTDADVGRYLGGVRCLQVLFPAPTRTPRAILDPNY